VIPAELAEAEGEVITLSRTERIRLIEAEEAVAGDLGEFAGLPTILTPGPPPLAVGI